MWLSATKPSRVISVGFSIVVLFLVEMIDFLVKFEPFASADRVHHMLLYGCDTPAMNTGFWRGSQTCSGVTHILYGKCYSEKKGF